jgi:toxin ParE1/3/4
MEIKYLEAALSDLDNITDYYYGTFGIESAQKIYEQIRNTISRLEQFPNSGKPSKDHLLHSLGYKEIYSGRFAIVYRADEGERKVYINHIADTQTDYPNLFKN